MNDDGKPSRRSPTKTDSKSAAVEYLTPRSRRRIYRQLDPSVPCRSEQIQLGAGHVAFRSWGQETGQTVLLVHGWSANQSDMFDLVEPLVNSGFKAVTIDLPSHGESSGSTASLEDLAAGVSAVAQTLGNIYGVVAHSVGCATVAMAISNGAFRPSKAVFLGPPESYEKFARLYAKSRGLSESEIEAMINELKSMGVRVELFSSALVCHFDFNGMVIHSDDDPVVPVGVGELVANSWPASRFVKLSGLGHRGILKDQQVIQLVRQFMTS